jgi:hypothetical protein
MSGKWSQYPSDCKQYIIPPEEFGVSRFAIEAKEHKYQWKNSQNPERDDNLGAVAVDHNCCKQ